MISPSTTPRLAWIRQSKIQNRKSKISCRSGLTLIELLIVVGIALAITAVAIPVLVPSLEQRRMLETSRNVTTVLAAARSRAIQTGRSCGVTFERNELFEDQAITISLAEVEPPYAGGYTGSRIHLLGGSGGYGVVGDGTTGPAGYGVTDASGGVDGSWLGLIRRGDLLKLNFQGHLYRIDSGEPFTDSDGDGVHSSGEDYNDLDGDTSYDAPQVDSTGMYITGLPWTITSETAPAIPTTPLPVDSDGDGVYVLDGADTPGGLPFQIIRQPGRSAAEPLELPETMVVDLTASGNDSVTLSGLHGPITILFTPGGAIDTIHWTGDDHAVGGSYRPTSPLFLLLGKRERIPPTVGQENWRDLECRWVAINNSTGLVTSSKNAVGATLAEVRRNAQISQGTQ